MADSCMSSLRCALPQNYFVLLMMLVPVGFKDLHVLWLLAFVLAEDYRCTY